MIVAALAVTATVLFGATNPATAGPAPTPGPGTPGLSPEIAALPASSPGLDAATADLQRATATRNRDAADLAASSAELLSTTQASAATTELLARRHAQIEKVEAALGTQREAIRSIVTEWFVDGTADQHAVDPTLGSKQLETLRRQAVLGAAASESATRGVRFLTSRASELGEEAGQLQRMSDRLGGRGEELTGRVSELGAALSADDQAVSAATAAATNARLNAVVDGTDISTVSLDAYWRAAATTALTNPSCGMTWWILAGIGRTESGHGTYLGSSVATDGAVTPPILGPVLDGTNGFSRVPDSDHGALDGDPVFDRAVGPMQFLPSTWKVVGRDGNGDGRADPDNVYDAALGAAVYLCRSGSVADDAGMRRAFLSYNHSQTYVDTVAGFATGYRDALALPGSPGR